MNGQKTCSKCGALSPEPKANAEESSLTSSLGWRLSLEPGPDGKPLEIWRCGDCWAAYRGRRRPRANQGGQG